MLPPEDPQVLGHRVLMFPRYLVSQRYRLFGICSYRFRKNRNTSERPQPMREHN